MQVRTIAAWALTSWMAFAAVPGAAQQDEGPILRPRAPAAAKPTGATLLVLCDLACDWKLDGKTQGRIDAGGSARAKVDLGQHLVVAVTDDGLDQIKEMSEVKTTGQTVVNLELKPVRDARIKAAQPAPRQDAPAASVPAYHPAAIPAPAPQAAPSFSTSAPHVLLDGTPVSLRLSQTISSANAKIGQEVPLEVVGDISVDQVVVLPRGAMAIAKVTAAEPSKKLSRSGKLDIAISYTRLKDQEKVPLRAGAGNRAKQSNNTGVEVAVTTILFWPAASYFLFAKGKDITIDKGTEITAYVDGDVHLDLSRFGASPAQLPALSAQAPSQVLIGIDSSPPGADIEIDGAFVGNTPSTISTASGNHQIVIRKNGYANWTKTLNVTSGTINLNAQLEPVHAH
jgi:hypothetical protein